MVVDPTVFSVAQSALIVRLLAADGLLLKHRKKRETVDAARNGRTYIVAALHHLPCFDYHLMKTSEHSQMSESASALLLQMKHGVTSRNSRIQIGLVFSQM